MKGVSGKAPIVVDLYGGVVKHSLMWWGRDFPHPRGFISQARAAVTRRRNGAPLVSPHPVEGLGRAYRAMSQSV